MIRQAFRRHPLLSTAFAFFALAALAFLVRFALGAVLWQSRADEPIRPWMTVGYIVHSRNLSPKDIDGIAGLPLPQRGHPQTLEEIAADRGVPVADIIAAVEAAIASLSAPPADPGPDGD